MFRNLMLLGTGALPSIVIASPGSGEMPKAVSAIGQSAYEHRAYTYLDKVTSGIKNPSRRWPWLSICSRGFCISSRSFRRSVLQMNILPLALTAIGHYSLVLHGKRKGEQP